MEDRIRYVEEILTSLHEAGVILKINKFHFFQHQVDYIGHVMKPDQIEIHKTKLQCLKQASPQANKRWPEKLTLGNYQTASFNKLIDHGWSPAVQWFPRPNFS